MPAFSHLAQPEISVILFSSDPAKRRTGAVDR
jgi:hypothetical protein